jgi:hypothetical protein
LCKDPILNVGFLKNYEKQIDVIINQTKVTKYIYIHKQSKQNPKYAKQILGAQGGGKVEKNLSGEAKIHTQHLKPQRGATNWSRGGKKGKRGGRR